MEKIGEKSLRLIADRKGIRLDAFLTDHLSPQVSRNRIQHLIKEGHILLNGKAVKPSYILKGGEVIEIHLPPPPPTTLLPEMIPLNILYEDEHLAVVEKPFGMLTHPVGNIRSGTLVNALLARFPLSSIGAPLRPGIVHRLDKDTGGLLVVAKTDSAHYILSQMLRRREIERRYKAIVYGEVDFEEKLVDAPLARIPHTKKVAVREGGKEARTILRRLKIFKGFSLLEARLLSGRTHQIRVHCAHIGHPILGDPLYSHRRVPPFLLPLLRRLGGQALYAYFLSFPHPFTSEQLRFGVSLPSPLEDIIKCLEEMERR